MSRRLKVLYVVHNHPSNRPGGAETYGYALFSAMQAAGELDAVFLAKTGPPISPVTRYHEGTLLTRVPGETKQYLFHTDCTEYDYLMGKDPNKVILTRFFREFLEAERPDIVHFQHTLFLGYDILHVTKQTLPNTPIVYTLHEYAPICHRNGQMLRTPEANNELCREESPRRCHECYPEIAPQDFFLRKRFVQAQFENVDLFLSPSHFLIERYVKWGIPREKIRFEENGHVRPEVGFEPEKITRRDTRKHLGFFGQLNEFKGVNVLLDAMGRLKKDGVDARLWLYGANLDFQPEDFRAEFKRLLRKAKDNVVFGGSFSHEDLPKLFENVDWVVLPSIWWENSPLVIQEAFKFGRPVICSDIGGMAEKVDDEVNGLHFRVGDPVRLASTLKRAVTTPGLWDTLRQGIPEVYSMDSHVASLTSIYRELTGPVPSRSEAPALEALT
jgi:glycosyltransferase involved in cell wall biosynthesis